MIRTSRIPKTKPLKTFVLTSPTGASGLERRDLPTPTLSANEVLVKVSAISLNPVDIKCASGKALYDSLKDNDPLILGWDLAGKVTEIGAGVSAFAKGDRVFGMVNFPGHGRAYAEYVAAPADHLAHVPDAISDAEAAATTLAALTAWQNLIQLADVQTGQRVLVHAAGGGVGHYAVQLAKERGAYVIGTSSASKRDFVLGLGADEHIDYHEAKFEEVLEPVDVVLDSLDADHLSRSLKIVKPGGHLLTIAAGFTDALETRAKEKNVTLTHHLVQSDGGQMTALAERLTDGRLRAEVSKTYSFDQLPEALRDVQGGSTRGKVVVVL